MITKQIPAGIAMPLMALSLSSLHAQSPVAPGEDVFKGRPYSPYANRAFPTQVFWGDQHLHTSWSGDAAASGTTLDPEDAVRFARGEQVKSNTGQPVKLSRPLDWICVTDHSDALGVVEGTSYDAARFGIEMDPEIPVAIQERAYTSPIWYTP